MNPLEKALAEVIAKLERECLRCGHAWQLREAREPKICPKCKSPYWDREKKHEKANR